MKILMVSKNDLFRQSKFHMSQGEKQNKVLIGTMKQRQNVLKQN